MMPTHRPLNNRLRLAAVAAIMIPAALTAATPALAHDALSSTNPAQDAVIAKAPETVSLTLSEPPADSTNLKLSTITVTDGAGNTVSDGIATVYGPSISTKTSAGTPGTYTVLWRTVSSDGHPIDGKYSFTVQAQAGQPVPAASTPGPSTAAPQPSATTSEEDRFRPPSNDNAPLVLGIVAAILAAAFGAALLIRRRRRNTGA